MGKIKKCVFCNNDFDPGKHNHVLTCSKDCYKAYRKTIEEDKVKSFKETFSNKFGSREKECATCGKTFNTGKHKEKLNCSPDCLKIYQDLHKEERIKKSKEAVKEKYGIDHISQLPDFAKKVKQTKLENHGDENYNNRDKAKETCIEKYGVENILQLESFSTKVKKTKLKKYGDENYNNREKAYETILEKYGVEHHLQLEEFMNKMKETNLEKYGEEHAINNGGVKEKMLKTMNEKYGYDYFFESGLHKVRQKEKAINHIQNLLLKGNLSFDFNDYTNIYLDNGKYRTYVNYQVVCNTCKNSFSAIFNRNVPVCRVCNPIKYSKPEIEIKNLLDKFNINYIQSARKIITPFELDFFIQDYNIALEINGNYFHSEVSGERDKNYHSQKTKLCDEKGIKLIHIFDDEIRDKKEIVHSRILNLLNNTANKIFARKCEIREVLNKDKNKFLNENHIQGTSADSYRIGLYHNNNLVSVMTFSKRRIVTGFKKSEEGEWELNRFCSLLNTNVVGGFERLLNHFKKNIKYVSIISYADCRWSGINPENTVYYKNGFEFLSQSRPSYFYLNTKDYLNRFHRFSYNKQTLLKLFNGDPNKTEWELAQENGFDRIWDCGTMKFELKFK